MSTKNISRSRKSIRSPSRRSIKKREKDISRKIISKKGPKKGILKKSTSKERSVKKVRILSPRLEKAVSNKVSIKSINVETVFKEDKNILSERVKKALELRERLKRERQLISQEELNKITNKSIDTPIIESLVLIQLAVNNIRDNMLKELSESLDKMPIDKLFIDNNNFLLNYLLGVAAHYNRQNCVRVIMDSWSKAYPIIMDVDFFIVLFTIEAIEEEVLAFVVKTYINDYTFTDVIIGLIKLDQSIDIRMACRKADLLYGEQKPTTYDMLRLLAKGENPTETYDILKIETVTDVNFQVQAYMRNKVQKYVVFAPIPKWVGNFVNGPIPKESELPIPYDAPKVKEPTKKEAIEIVIKGLSQMGLSNEEIKIQRQILKQKFFEPKNKEEEVEVKDIILRITKQRELEALQDNPQYYRYYGPSNPYFQSDLEELELGGCRMFFCKDYDFNEETGYEEDWFTGNCDFCLKRIRRRWHAVRMPRQYGGWKGGYCSWDCVRNDNIQYGKEPELLTLQLTYIFEDQINQIGIQDRISDE